MNAALSTLLPQPGEFADEQIFGVVPRGHPELALRFTPAQSELASDEWGASCGLHSLAAACAKSLDEIRPVLTGFKGWMNPTMITDALVRLRIPHRRSSGLRTAALCNGINRIQWEGSWLNPGVPPRIAYNHTHWVAHFDGWVLCTAAIPYLWCRVDRWTAVLQALEKRWHVTHHYSFTAHPDLRS